MADILINDVKPVKGKVSIVRGLDLSKNPPVLNISGQLMTHWYIEEINTIETERYLIKGVQVLQESFGSEDFNIIYTFVANSVDVKGGETCYGKDYINEKESKLYGGE